MITALNSGQTAAEGTVFGSPLRALVADAYGNPISGATVTFTAPSSPPTVTFNVSGGTSTGTTDASGVALSASVTAGSTLGTVTVTASINGASTTFSLNIVAGTAERLAFTQAPPPLPATPPAGANLPVTVQLEDNNEMPVHVQGTPVTLHLISGTLVGNPTAYPGGISLSSSAGQVMYALITVK